MNNSLVRNRCRIAVLSRDRKKVGKAIFLFFSSFPVFWEELGKGRADSAKRWGFTRGFLKYRKGIKDFQHQGEERNVNKNVSKLDTLGLLSSGRSKQSVKLSNQGCWWESQWQSPEKNGRKKEEKVANWKQKAITGGREAQVHPLDPFYSQWLWSFLE